jgi:hypothetical protein
MSSAHSVFEVIFFFLVQPDCEIELPEIEHGPLPMNIVGHKLLSFLLDMVRLTVALSICRGLQMLKVDCHP